MGTFHNGAIELELRKAKNNSISTSSALPLIDSNSKSPGI